MGVCRPVNMSDKTNPTKPEVRLIEQLLTEAEDAICTWLEDRDASPTQATFTPATGGVKVDEENPEYEALYQCYDRIFDCLILLRGSP